MPVVNETKYNKKHYIKRENKNEFVHCYQCKQIMKDFIKVDIIRVETNKLYIDEGGKIQ